MAKFCTKCGKPTEECTCDTKVANTTEKVSNENNSKKDFNWDLNSWIDIVKGIFVKPIDTIKEYSKDDNFILGIISIVLNSLITGVMFYLFLDNASSSLSSISGFEMLGLMGGLGIEIPFVKTVLYVALFMLVMFFTSVVMIQLLAGNLFKADSTFKKSISLVGTCAVLTTITSVVAIICAYISPKLFVILLALAAILYSKHLYHGIGAVTKIDENKQGYTYLVMFAVTMFVTFYILPKILF